MTKVLPLCVLLLCTSAFAKTNTHRFAYGLIGYPCACASIQEWDGNPNAYSNDMGTVYLNLYDNPYSGMVLPQALGYPNNGYCTSQTPFAWQPFVWTNGNATTAGSTGYQIGNAAYGGYCSGVYVHTTVYYIVHKHVGRFGHIYYTTDETNGAGTVTYQ